MYVVQAGDTLSSIAAALWGDASLWWKLAEVNGLTAESALPEGLPLIIPAGVIVHHNNATTYQPYDPLEVLGNTSPTAPAPQGKKGRYVTVNNRHYAADGSYRIPPLGRISIDWTLAPKTNSTPQVQGFFNARRFPIGSPVGVVIVRPTRMGGSYYLAPPPPPPRR